MTTGIVWVIFGALAIAIGGASTTYGWSKIAGETEKRNHVEAIARALHFNTEYMSIWPLDIRDEPTKAGVEHWAFPEFKNEPMSTALLSSYFSSSNERFFMIALANYEALAQAHNKEFERHNEFLKINLEKMGKEAVLKKYEEVRWSEGYMEFSRYHEILREGVEEIYPGVIDKTKKDMVVNIVPARFNN